NYKANSDRQHEDSDTTEDQPASHQSSHHPDGTRWPVRPNKNPKIQRNDTVEQNPTGVPDLADAKVKSQLQNSFDEKKNRQKKSERKHAQKRVHQHVNSGSPINQSKQHLPKDSADAVRMKGKDQMLNSREQK